MRILDLFCGEGGCSAGYAYAGFDSITGVDILPMPRYPYDFFQWDALDFLEKHGHEFDFIHASPPCQEFSVMKNVTKKTYINLIPQTRALLKEIGVPYVIENVKNAPLNWTLHLQGDMFRGLLVKRERRFEISFPVTQLSIPAENLGIPKANSGANPINGFISIVGKGGLGGGLGIDYARKAMNTPWMSRAAISQAIPPQYTQYIGAEWLKSQGLPHTYPDMRFGKQPSLFKEQE